MKKIVATLFIVIMVVVVCKREGLSYYYYGFYDNFGELNVKLGPQLGEIKAIKSYSKTDNISANENNQESVNVNLNPGFCFTGEYLVLCKGIEFLKFGPGFSYLLPREIDSNDNKDSYSYIPAYLTLQVNPFISAYNENLQGIFVKGNFGYSVLFNFKRKDLSAGYKFKNTGGIYWGLFLGYESPAGVIIDFGYCVYKSNIEVNNSDYYEEVALTYNTVTLNVGYKIRT
jgi:hypothetical protein